ncbi:unnamed protein product [Blepharisma stoltei]|uniref:Uncharacterized protein n=1 Tax=Blepharisma stoltei TaxID=1481888 RepID=A0AAU9K9U0_9CILI|nr:unnamed protein product [Blepharisma stoltei]
MVYSKLLNALVVLTLLSFAKGFTLLGDWTLRRLTADTITGIANLKNGGNPPITTDSSIDLGSLADCSSINLSGGQTWILIADVSSLIDASEYTFGFWINFESTISGRVFRFGNSIGPFYSVSSRTDGTLKVAFGSASGVNYWTHDFSFTVPLNKWCFIAFHFINNSGIITLEVLLTGIAKISKTFDELCYAWWKIRFWIVKLRENSIELFLQRVPP